MIPSLQSVLRRIVPASLLTSALIALAVPAAFAGGGFSAAPGLVAGTPSEQVGRVRFQSRDSCLRLAAAGVNTRNAGSPTTGGVITLPPGPAASNIVWAGLYWVTLGGPFTCPAGGPNAVTLNNSLVSPVAIGASGTPCWFNTTSFAYFADVTALVVAGANSVAGLDDGGVLGVCSETEGASLLVVYRSQTSAACEIVITDGNDLVTTGQTTIDNTLTTTCNLPAPGRLTFVGGDGQIVQGQFFADDQRWNGVALGDGDDFDDSDPQTAGANPGWDTDTWPVVVAPPMVATVSSTSDCVNWVATALEVGVRDCIVTPTRRGTWGELKLRYR